jgi:hypothetical protein
VDVIVGVKDGVAVAEGVCVGVREGVIVGVGVYDNATIVCCASAVSATDVRVAFRSRVGEGVCVGVLVGVNVNVGVDEGV